MSDRWVGSRGGGGGDRGGRRARGGFADSGGRGRGRASGDDRGWRGGYGDGDRGRGRAFGDDRGGRGGYGDGGRGRGRGDAASFMGGRGDRGSGGRGRGRGGQVPPEAWRPEYSAEPDTTVESFETKLIKRDTITSRMSAVQLSPATPLRPGYGKDGIPVIVWTNYFRLNTKQSGIQLFRYHVEVAPELVGTRREVKSTKYKARMIKLALGQEDLTSEASAIATDYRSNVVSSNKFKNGEESFNVQVAEQDETEDAAPEGARMINVRFQFIGLVTVSELLDYLSSTDMGAACTTKQETLQALNIIVNHHAKSMDPSTALSTKNNVHFVVRGPNAVSSNLGAGLEAWRGYFTSVRCAAQRLLVNVQIKHGAMYRADRLDMVVQDFMRENGGNPLKLDRFLRHVRVDRLHLRKNGKSVRAKTITGLASPGDGRGQKDDQGNAVQPPKVSRKGAGAKDVQIFIGPNPPPGLTANNYVSVFDYFDRVHRCKANPNIPIVNVGSSGRPVYLITEVCKILPAQACNAKLSPSQTAAMIKFAVRKPYENVKSIAERGFVDVGLASEDNIMSRFGLSVAPHMLAVQARILPSPKLLYANRDTQTPTGASWNLNRSKFVKGATLSSWSIIWVRNPRIPDAWNGEVNRFTTTLHEFTKTVRDSGVNCADAHLPGELAQLNNEGNEEAAIDQAFQRIVDRRLKEQLLLVVLPQNNEDLYSVVKQLGDIKYGIHTVCVVGSKLANRPGANQQYFANVALKFNLKLGGTNHLVDDARIAIISKGKTMLVGLDVTHPSPGSSESAPSVAAMVASIDKNIAQFPVDLRIQTGRQERVNDLKSMLISRLRLWQKHNRDELPENIVVYRDGVSEGQYPMVIDQELPLLREACKELYAKSRKQPSMSIIVVGKRHSTRFYPSSTKPTEIDQRSSNTINGTIVDRGITEPRNWDFFLQAHMALQGTAKPAHYFVVYDEIFRNTPLPPGCASAADALEHLTHNICYAFGRATKAVSYAPPAYYADIACERARRYLTDVFSPNASQAESASMASATGYAETIRVHENLKDSMFFV